MIELIAQMTEDMSASIFVVLHTPNLAYVDVVAHRLQRNSVFTCKLAEHNATILSRHVYLAVPDKHLLIKEGKMILGNGALENRWRPSIDVLLRSAAVAYDSQVIGVILTGMLEDGVSGMQAIKECGGTSIVQDPEEAEYPDLPLAVLRTVPVDYCTTLQRIAIILQEKCRGEMPEKKLIPQQIAKEAEVAERGAAGIEDIDNLGDRSAYSCPDCGGALWEIKHDKMSRFRCHTGHMYNGNELLNSKRKELETSLWVALRILEERKNLLRKMSEEELSKGWLQSSAYKKQRSSELEMHIERIKTLLFEEIDKPEPTKEQVAGR